MIVRKRTGGSETDIVEIVKTVVKQPSKADCKEQPRLPPVEPSKQELEHDYVTLDAISLSICDNEYTPWNTLVKDLKCKWAKDAHLGQVVDQQTNNARSPVAQKIMVKAEQLSDAIQVYIKKMSERDETLKQHIYELRCVADNLDKVSKGTKIAGITGGATTVAGGVAAAAGVILSPFTLGASLALTAVGVGVAAAGGVTGASAAIANKVNVTQDKKKIDKTLHDYEEVITEIQACLKVISDGMEQLRQHGLSTLIGTKMDSARLTKVVELAVKGGASASALEANSKASGLIKGFALGMDSFYIQGKDGPKVKKGLESKFAKKIRSLAEDLETGLDELIKMKDMFREHCSGV
ncbi:apolipoprotein L3-like [Acanthochromis polyacanthus]|uniref:apolipoprotein L3-like n=1 Tax=Acanthochromis polyacanthus TaxID=80966 RepID=UPI002234D8F0|nr:apolipoprotein L3-like [Acanthochromis polyacanthus]